MNAPKVIRVTADHIARGEKKTADACPIALAVKAAWPPAAAAADYISVEPRWIKIYGGDSNDWFTCWLPGTAQCFVEDFDNGDPVAPFEFTVEWIDQDGVGV